MEPALHDYPNLRGKKPFNSETARNANRLSILAKRNAKLALELELSRQQPPTQAELNEVVLRQIQEIDHQFKKASPANRVLLATAKAKLWALIYAKPRPRNRVIPMPTIEPLHDEVSIASIKPAVVTQPGQ